MTSVIQWFLFGMMVWGCCIFMSALARRFAPDMAMDADGCETSGRHHRRIHPPSAKADEVDERDAQIRALQKRVETLEAIVTDRRFQWEQEYRTGNR